MNYLLVLIILGLGWGGYYEYGHMQQQNVRDKQEFEATTNARMTHLEEENTKLQADNAGLTKKLAAMTAQLSPPAPPAQPATPEPSKPPPLPSNDLGSIMTTDGKKFGTCHLLKVDATGITISCASGITKINFDALPASLQKRFGVDSRQGSRLAPPQVQTLEEQRARSEQQATTTGA